MAHDGELRAQSEGEYLRALLGQAIDGDPWHGPPLARLLVGLHPDQAAAHPIAGVHSIWELVLHIAAWHREVGRRVAGSLAALPAEGEWPAVHEISLAAWERALEDLRRSRIELDAAIADAGDLARPVGAVRDPHLGTGVTVRDTLAGVIQHDAYHAGQIALLRHALGLHD